MGYARISVGADENELAFHDVFDSHEQDGPLRTPASSSVGYDAFESELRVGLKEPGAVALERW